MSGSRSGKCVGCGTTPFACFACPLSWKNPYWTTSTEKMGLRLQEMAVVVVDGERQTLVCYPCKSTENLCCVCRKVSQAKLCEVRHGLFGFCTFTEASCHLNRRGTRATPVVPPCSSGRQAPRSPVASAARLIARRKFCRFCCHVDMNVLRVTYSDVSASHGASEPCRCRMVILKGA
jgi:hypothetical protein